MTYETLFDYIKKEGIKPERIEKIIFDWSPEKCIKFITNCNDLILYEGEIKDNPSKFNFISSDSLSGGAGTCVYHGCRLKRADSLARFSSLYADKVIIQNPFNRPCKKFDFENKLLLIGDLEVLFKIKPLLNNDIISIGRESLCLCKDCLKRQIENEKNLSKKIRDGKKIIIEEYLDKIKITYFNSAPSIAISGPIEILEHTTIFTLKKGNPFFNLVTKMNIGEEIKDKKIKREVLHWIINPAFNELFLEEFYNTKGYNTITDKNLDIFIREKIEPKEENLETTRILTGLTHTIPSIEKISIDNLIKLRLKEEEALKVYRENINKLVKGVNKKISEEKIKELFSSEIQPILNELDLILEKNKKDASQSFMKKALISGGLLSVGLFSNIPVLSLLGGFGTLDSISNDLVRRFKIPQQIQTNKYYFLWKMARR